MRINIASQPDSFFDFAAVSFVLPDQQTGERFTAWPEIDSFVITAALLYSASRSLHLDAPLTQSLTPLDSLLFNIVLATLAIGLPILVVLSIRFLWDRNLKLGLLMEGLDP